MMGIKEGICCAKHCVLHGSVESIDSTPETNLHCMLANWNLNENI